jgi:hypothetical protein
MMKKWFVRGVKFTLEKWAGINVQKHERNCSPVIVDSLKAYSYLDNNKAMYNIMSIMGSFLEQAENIGKKGITIISDIGSFYLFKKVDDLPTKDKLLFPQKNKFEM